MMSTSNTEQIMKETTEPQTGPCPIKPKPEFIGPNDPPNTKDFVRFCCYFTDLGVWITCNKSIVTKRSSPQSLILKQNISQISRVILGEGEGFENLDVKAFQQMVEFIHTDTVIALDTLNKEELNTLISMARIFELVALASICSSMLELIPMGVTRMMTNKIVAVEEKMRQDLPTSRCENGGTLEPENAKVIRPWKSNPLTKSGGLISEEIKSNFIAEVKAELDSFVKSYRKEKLADLKADVMGRATQNAMEKVDAELKQVEQTWDNEERKYWEDKKL